MYYVITDQGVIGVKKLSVLEKKYNMKMDQLDFTSVGGDFVIKISDKDIEFVKDAAKLNTLALNKLFKVDSMPKTLLYIVMIMQFITMVKK